MSPWKCFSPVSTRRLDWRLWSASLACCRRIPSQVWSENLTRYNIIIRLLTFWDISNISWWLYQKGRPFYNCKQLLLSLKLSQSTLINEIDNFIFQLVNFCDFTSEFRTRRCHSSAGNRFRLWTLEKCRRIPSSSTIEWNLESLNENITWKPDSDSYPIKRTDHIWILRSNDKGFF